MGIGDRPDLGETHIMLAAAREEERCRLARELHDVLGPTMAAATMRVETARCRLAAHPAAAEMIGLVLGDLRQAVADIRRLARESHGEDSSTIRLVNAMAGHARQFEQASAGLLLVQVIGPARHRRVPAAVDGAVRRIVGEALANALRHAHARRFHVRLEVLDERDLGVEIYDDGIGIPADATPGLGLVSMAERVRELHGTLRISANHPTGTRISVRIPLEASER